jgi:hypothetical protein
MQRRFLYWLGYVVPSLYLYQYSLSILNFHLLDFFEGKSVAYTISFGVIIVMP